jgi:serine O-acetyltransferase
MIKKLQTIIAVILFLPHLLLFVMSNKKDIIAKDLYARRTVKTNCLSQYLDLAYELFSNKYFRTLFYFRTHGLFSKLLRVVYPKHASFTIDIHTKIGSGLILAHPYATILNAESIGNNVYVNHLVTLGEKNGKKPIIGNEVELHANATVIGGVTIGDYAVIGAGAVVVKDVPAHAIAVGNPARILQPKV